MAIGLGKIVIRPAFFTSVYSCGIRSAIPSACHQCYHNYNWRQSLSCCRTASIELQTDGAETAAIDGLVSSWSENIFVSFCLRAPRQAPYMTSQFTRVAYMPNWRRLRSASYNQLDVPSFRLPTVGSHAFPIAGAKVWNSLPDDVTSASFLSTFRHHLKTYLFCCCYNIVWYCSYLLWL